MATFVSLATCPHCPMASPRRGLVYADSLSVLSRNLRGPRWPPGPRQQGVGLARRHLYYTPTRPHLPESFAVAGTRPSSDMKHLVLTHLRKLLMLSPAHQRAPRTGPGLLRVRMSS